MRISKILTGSLIAGSALLVVACGSNEDAAANNAAMNVEETLPMNDTTSIDAMNGTDANLGAAVDANATTTDMTGADANATTTETTTTTNTTTTNGM